MSKTLTFDEVIDREMKLRMKTTKSCYESIDTGRSSCCGAEMMYFDDLGYHGCEACGAIERRDLRRQIVREFEGE